MERLAWDRPAERDVQNALGARIPIRTTRYNVHLADLEVAYRDAVLKRLPTETERAHPYVGAAEHTVDEIVPKLNK